MNASRSVREFIPRIVALGITQVIGWGATFNLPGVLGNDIASSLDISLTLVLTGPAIMLVTMALVGFQLADQFEQRGARPILLSGTALAAAGLAVVSVSQALPVYFLGWLILGVAGAGCLTTATHIAISEFAGAQAKQAIGLMALLSGLSSTIFWPVCEFVSNQVGWRSTVALLALLILVGSGTIVRWAVPPRAMEPVSHSPSAPARKPLPLNLTDFALVAMATAANGFITWGFSITLIELYEQRGLDRNDALTLASLLGVVGLAARAVDFLGGRHWSGLTTGIAASAVLFGSYLLLLSGTGWVVVATFTLLYGLSSGAMSVARSTIPLAIFPLGSYARASSRLALPLNLAYASAPPAFGAMLSRGNVTTALLVATALSLVALGCLLVLHVRHRSEALPA